MIVMVCLCSQDHPFTIKDGVSAWFRIFSFVSLDIVCVEFVPKTVQAGLLVAQARDLLRNGENSECCHILMLSALLHFKSFMGHLNFVWQGE